MRTSALRSIAAEFFVRASFQMGFVTLMVAVMERTSRAMPLGYVSLSMIAPGLLFTASSGWVMARLRPLRALRWSSVARAIVFGAGANLGTKTWHFAAVAALSSLLQQSTITAKLTYDTELLPSVNRARFNARRAFASSLAMIVGPAAGGVVAASLGAGTAATLTAMLGLLGALLPARVPAPAAGEAEGAARRPSAQALFRWLGGQKELAALMVADIVVLAILAMEAPLVFPFVRETYGESTLAGPLLGACGMGALLGAIVMDRHGKPLGIRPFLLVLALDGLMLLLSTQGYPRAAVLSLFGALGIISSVALVTVETSVQENAPRALQPYLFSTLYFAGGIGGAALTLVSTWLADIHGAARVLRCCALFEIVLGLGACLTLRLSRSPHTPPEKLDGYTSGNQPR